MGRQTLMFLFCALMVSACVDESAGHYGVIPQYPSRGYSPIGLGAESLPRSESSGRKIAILLPLTGARAELGQQMLQAAQLALKNDPGLSLDVLDTAGTVAGASAAVVSAVDHGDSLILGPLTSAETAVVSPVARRAGIPVLAFTNDTSQSQPGVWPLGISLDQQIERLLSAAQSQGKTRFAALLPETGFGNALAIALTRACADHGLDEPIIKLHSPGMAAITAATRDISDYVNRRGPIDAKIKAARALGTADGRRQAQELVKTPIPPPPFDVLLLGDTGDDLQEVAAVMPYYDVDRSLVQIVGPALWADPASGSASVLGALYAAPDSNMRASFEREYSEQYGSEPSPVADLAYDAAAIARVAEGPTGINLTALTQTSGFVGSDGWLALSNDGHVRRGLAVFKIERGGREMVAPAPDGYVAPAL